MNGKSGLMSKSQPGRSSRCAYWMQRWRATTPWQAQLKPVTRWLPLRSLALSITEELESTLVGEIGELVSVSGRCWDGPLFLHRWFLPLHRKPFLTRLSVISRWGTTSHLFFYRPYMEHKQE